MVPSKVEIYSPCTSIAILDIHPQETCAYVDLETCKGMATGEIMVFAKN